MKTSVRRFFGHGLALGLGLAATGLTVNAAVPPGDVRAWGNNFYGQTTVPPGLSGVTAIAAGPYHTVALKSDGTVVAWGHNGWDQTAVPADLTNVTAIAAGANLSSTEAHTVALKSDGTVVAWGDSMSVTMVPTGLSGVTAIAAGGRHMVALKSDGTVVTWGYNAGGSLNVPAGLSGVTAIAAANNYTVALKSDGTVVAWGYLPTNVPAGVTNVTNMPLGLTNVTAIAAGPYHTVALKRDGTVVAWGWNTDNQTTVPPGLSGVTAIAAGGIHTVALKSDGTVVAWGWNPSGLTTAPPGLTNVTAIAAGQRHTVVLVSAASPSILAQPQSQTVAAGSTATFSVSATGPSLSYFWRKDGELLPAATNRSLTVSTVTRAASGAYSFIATNASGSVTSAPALLRVLVAQQMERPEKLAEGAFKLRFGDSDGRGLTDADKNGFTLHWSTNLVQWFDLNNATRSVVGGKVELQDTDAVGRPHRFYRVIER